MKVIRDEKGLRQTHRLPKGQHNLLCRRSEEEEEEEEEEGISYPC